MALVHREDEAVERSQHAVDNILSHLAALV
jgi:hypothetical protein